MIKGDLGERPRYTKGLPTQPSPIIDDAWWLPLEVKIEGGWLRYREVAHSTEENRVRILWKPDRNEIKRMIVEDFPRLASGPEDDIRDFVLRWGVLGVGDQEDTYWRREPLAEYRRMAAIVNAVLVIASEIENRKDSRIKRKAECRPNDPGLRYEGSDIFAEPMIRMSADGKRGDRVVVVDARVPGSGSDGGQWRILLNEIELPSGGCSWSGESSKVLAKQVLSVFINHLLHVCDVRPRLDWSCDRFEWSLWQGPTIRGQIAGRLMLFVANAQDVGVCAACSRTLWLSGAQLRADSDGRRVAVYCKSCGRRESVKANMRAYYRAHRDEIKERRRSAKLEGGSQVNTAEGGENGPGGKSGVRTRRRQKPKKHGLRRTGV